MLARNFRRVVVAGLIGVMLGAAPALAKDGMIRLPTGSTVATVDGAVSRGKTQVWHIPAHQGQVMKVTVDSPSNAAIVQIRMPDKTSGFVAGATDKDNARSWSGTIATAGTYLVEVLTSQGATPYTLKLELK